MCHFVRSVSKKIFCSVCQTRQYIVHKNFLCLVIYFVFQIIVDDDGERTWSLYDAGPKTIRCPIMFLPPASGGADVFYKQLLSLSGAGYRVIGVRISG